MLVLGTLILVLAAALFAVRDLQAWWARRAAIRLLDRGELTAALDRLAWSARFAPGDGRADLVRASCYRQRRQQDRFDDAIRSARQKDAPPTLIERESKLADLQAGNIPPDAEAQLVAMVEAGTSANDAYGAFIFGCLLRGDGQRAQRFLEAWEKDAPEDPTVAFMQGVFWASAGNPTLARNCLETALARQPANERARTALAQLLEEQGDLHRALAHRVELARRSPADETTILSLARLLRRLGRAGDAKKVTATLASRDDLSPDAVWELGEIALETGDYEGARARFRSARLSTRDACRSALDSVPTMAVEGNVRGAETLLADVTSYATADSLEGNAYSAGKVFAQLNAVYDRIQQTNDLRARLEVNPTDPRAAGRLADLLSKPLASSAQNPLEQKPESDAALYARHCSACHGENGDGNGRAARHLYPRPKSLRSGSFRLIRTLNGVPSLQDLELTISRGMPGSSMPPFENLGTDAIAGLAREVIRFYHEGLREQIVAAMGGDDQPLQEQEILETLQSLTSEGEPAEIPAIGPPGPDSATRGRQVYDRMGCIHCHGQDGRGPGNTLLVDDEGRLTSSRDLACEPLKGGEDPQAVYLRILLGMPGTPHPACTGLTATEMVDLVHFCLSLRRQPDRSWTNHDRSIRAARPAVPIEPGQQPAP